MCILSPGRVTKKVGKDVVDREFVFCIFFSYICYNYCLWGMFYGAHCTNAHAQWQLPRCPIFEFIWNCTCYAGWRGAELPLNWLESAAIDAVSPIVLQGAGIIMFDSYNCLYVLYGASAE